jgi:hypothetical protein
MVLAGLPSLAYALSGTAFDGVAKSAKIIINTAAGINFLKGYAIKLGMEEKRKSKDEDYRRAICNPSGVIYLTPDFVVITSCRGFSPRRPSDWVFLVVLWQYLPGS